MTAVARSVSPAARDVARIAVERGVVVSELRGARGARLRAELLEADDASSLSDVEWGEVAALVLEATEKAARSSASASAGQCRSCGQPVRWVQTTRGKHMPIDPLPTPAGNIHIRASGSRLLAFVSGNQDLPISAPAYRAHAATCPRRLKPVPKSEVPVRHCRVCGRPMDPDLWAAGDRDHPTCGRQA